MNTFISIISVFFLFFASAFPVFASEFRSGERISVPQGSTVSGNLYAAGDDVVVDGTVTGDVLCAAKNVTIRGSVAGDILCIAQALTVDGVVDGNVRSLSQEISIGGTVKRNVTVFGQLCGITGAVGGDTVVGGQDVVSGGTVGGSLYTAGKSIDIRGKISGDAITEAETVRVSEESSISGTLSSETGTVITVAPGAWVGKTVSRPSSGKTENIRRRQGEGTRGIGDFVPHIWSLLSLCIIGGLAVLLFPSGAGRVRQEMMERPRMSFLVGILTCCIVPVFILALILTIVGIPFAILAGILLAALFVGARLFFALAIGGALLSSAKKGKQGTIVSEMLIGIAVTWGIFLIPFVGPVVETLGGIWALGGIVSAIKKR